MDTTMVDLNLGDIYDRHTYQVVREIDTTATKLKVVGEDLPRKAEVAAPAGALVVRTAPTGPGRGYRIAFLIVDTETETGLRVLWEQEYKSNSGRWGKTTARVLEELLTEHPVATSGYALTWGTRYRGPNTESGSCHWCGHLVPYYKGNVHGWGDAEWMEHKEEEGCVRTRAQNGDPCDECGVTVSARNAHRQYLHGKKNTWTARHNKELNCTRTPVPSYEEIEATERAEEERRKHEAAELRRESERNARLFAQARAERDARRAEAADRERAAEEAEAARVTALEPARTVTSVTVRSKPIWAGASEALMIRHDLELSDGSTGTRWTTSWGEGTPHHQIHECATEAQARAHYREVFYATPCPKGVQKPKPVRIDPSIPYEGPTMEVTRGSAQVPLAGEKSGPYRRGVAQRVAWHLIDEEKTPDWGPETVPGYTTSSLNPHVRTGIVVPLTKESEYYPEDGLSFGVGDDSGYVHSATTRPATQEEARHLLQTEQWRKHQVNASHALYTELSTAKWSFTDRPLGASPNEAVLVPTGEQDRIYTRPTLRVDWWDECLWRVNPYGDDGWRPLTPALEERLEEMFDLFPPLD